VAAAEEAGGADGDASIFSDDELALGVVAVTKNVDVDIEGSSDGGVPSVFSGGLDAGLVHFSIELETLAISFATIINNSVSSSSCVEEDVGGVDGVVVKSFEFDGSQVFPRVGVIVLVETKGTCFSFRIPVGNTGAPLIDGATKSVGEDGDGGQSKKAQKTLVQ